ncbi:aspartate--tRNA ligase dps1 [Boothiomyces sp. JEL0838]|nr:aspartate--tRNA ligase dps1 [Boothiomyces sp. JEL0838]
MTEQTTEKLSELVLDAEGKPLTKNALKKLQKEREKEERKRQVAERLEQERLAREAASPDYSVDFYGKLPMNQSHAKTDTVFVAIKDIGEEHVDKAITLNARVQVSRPTGAKMLFVTLRQRTETVQSILVVDEATVSKQMLKFATGISAESLVKVEAVVTKSPELIKSCTVQNYELKITKIYVISSADRLPFTMEDASRPIAQITEESGFSPIHLDTRLNNRVIDLRTITNQAIFRIQATITKHFRNFLDTRGFTEIHTPKINGGASEGGANVFEVPYFKEKAFLAQSPQLHKQMMICADFDRVYEIAPVFRAENSLTHRHMTEFTGLDLEMAFNEHYHEVLYMLGEMFVAIFDGIKKDCANELEIVNRQYPFPEFKYLPKTLILEFPEAIQLLRDAGLTVDDHEDFNTATEKKLGELVKEKYNTDFFILDKFPLSVRPFYTMPDPNKPGYSNSYDFFMRGEEILSGAQRIHDAEYLTQRATEFGIDVGTIKPYIDAFKYGASPHAGGGVGLERVLMFYLNLGNIRKSTLFPRDPKRLAP